MIKSSPLVGIIMGSDSDEVVMKEAAKVLKEWNIPYEMTVVSAHRTPERMVGYASTALDRGIRVIIAGAGGSAHLPGMVASLTTLPVIGVPVKSDKNKTEGWDSVLSILQMPGGVPVATVAINGGKNAGILAAQILATSDSSLQKKIQKFKGSMKNDVMKAAKKMERKK